MKIRIASDLHLNWHRDCGLALAKELAQGDFDVMVLAGDLADGPYLDMSVRLILAAIKRPLVYVAGNHDFYHRSREYVLETCANIARRCPDFYFLENSSATVLGQHFVGTTLWFPYDGPNGHEALMQDFKVVPGLSQWVGRVAKDAASYLRGEVTPESIVITHHLPSHICVDPEFCRSPLNKFFVHPVDDLLGTPKIWIHGHTHSKVDCYIGDCRVLCNPHGYPTEAGNFKPLDIQV